MILEYIFWAFVFYWLFRFIFNFVVPVFRVTRQMRGQVRDFNSTTTNRPFQGEQPGSTTSAKPQQKPAAGDYIDFEEIK